MDQELILELPNDIRSIEHAVVYVMRHCSTCCDYARRFNLNFRVGLTEALSNAMLYGNNRDPNKRVRIEVTVRVEEIAVRVTDNNYENNASGSLIWQGDSMQIAFDVADNNGTPYDTTDDFEYGWARAAGDAPASFRWFTPSGSLIEGEGLTPDVILEPLDDDEDEDLHLDRAIEILKEQLSLGG